MHTYLHYRTLYGRLGSDHCYSELDSASGFRGALLHVAILGVPGSVDLRDYNFLPALGVALPLMSLSTALHIVYQYSFSEGHAPEEKCRQ